MVTNEKPRIKIELDSDLYNVLMTILTDWSNRDIDTIFKFNSSILFKKIEKYAYLIKSKNREYINIYFFENEASILIETLILTLYSHTDVKDNFFNKLQSKKKFK